MKTPPKMIAATLAVLGILPHQARAADTKPALYTAAQAQAGASVYQQSCAVWHGSLLEGGAAPALKGPAFGEMATAQGLTVDSLITVVSATMPQSDPGSLTPNQVNAVVAYILQENSYPAGSAALAPGNATLKDIKVTPPGTRYSASAALTDNADAKPEVAKKVDAKAQRAGAKIKKHHEFVRSKSSHR